MIRRFLIFGMVFLSSSILLFSTAHASIRSINNSVKTSDYAVTDNVCPDNLLSFAQSLIGTRYRAASANPSHGFDCSGFVSYVFKNFSFKVPRSSGDFISVGEKVALADAKPGDVILFTGTDRKDRHIGHIAIVMTNRNSELTFIHSTSGKEHGVTITAMDKRYKRRFVQVIRLLKQNDTVYNS